MAKYPDQFIQQVLQTTDIVELVGKYVSLKKSGKEFVGLCPFHDDHNPSMFVSPVKQIYKCFVCGSGGNVLQFVMNFERQSFPEAIKTLAEMASIPLPKESELPAGREPGMSRSDLLKVTAFAADFFKRQLVSPGGKAALAYARNRGLSDETIDRFDLGYAPDRWDALILAARKHGFGSRQLMATGLCRKGEHKGDYDYFRNRLIFPIKDISGKTVAFGGRALSAEDGAKYLNSPQGPLYDKSSLLYPMDIAREKISRSGRAVVVEGYLDALMPHQEGVDNVVATLGTSLTDRHVRLLGRFAREAILLFDADVAGASATARAIELFLAQKIHIRVAEIPSGKDPCDYVLSEGGKALENIVENSVGAIEFVWNCKYREFVGSEGNLARRNEIIDDFLGLIVQSGRYDAIDAVRQQNLAQHIAHLIDISAPDLRKRMNMIASKSRGPSSGTATGAATSDMSRGPEREIIEILLHDPSLFGHVVELIGPGDFRDPVFSSIAECIWRLGEEERLSLEELMGQEDMVEFGAILAGMGMEAGNRRNHETAMTEAVNQLIELRNRRNYLAARKKSGDNENETDLLDKIREAHENKDNVLCKFRGIKEI